MTRKRFAGSTPVWYFEKYSTASSTYLLQYRIIVLLGNCSFISAGSPNLDAIPFIFFFVWPRVSSGDCFEVFGFPISHSRRRGADSIKTLRAINKASISRSTLPCPSILQFGKRVSSVHTEINFSPCFSRDVKISMLATRFPVLR